MRLPKVVGITDESTPGGKHTVSLEFERRLTEAELLDLSDVLSGRATLEGETSAAAAKKEQR